MADPIIKRFAFWEPESWAIPKLYWDAFSQEQRIHAICKQLSKVIGYADYLGVNVDDIAQRLKAIEDGQLDPYIIAEIEDWFDNNEPAIVAAIEALNDALPITAFDGVNTVEVALDALENRFPVSSSDIGTGAVTTAKLADGAVTTDKLPSSAVTGAKIANSTITSDKLADGVISRGYLGVVGDSFSDNTSEWPTIVKNHLGYTGLINKAVAGSGFIRAGYKNFETQFAELLADANFDKVTDIVIYGGVNDYVHTSQTVSDYTSAWQSIYNMYTALPAKTRPRLFMVFGNCHSVPRKSALAGYAAFCDEANVQLQQMGFAVVDGAKYWLLAELDSVDSGDGIHCNALGRKIIAGYMLQVLEGCYSGVVKRHKLTNLNNIPAGKVGFIDFEFNNGTFSFYFATNTNVIENVTGQYVRLYENANLYLEIGATVSYTDYNMLKAPPRHIVQRTGAGSRIYTVLVDFVMYFQSAAISFGIYVDGTGNASDKLAALENYGVYDSNTQELTLNSYIARAAGN